MALQDQIPMISASCTLHRIVLNPEPADPNTCNLIALENCREEQRSSCILHDERCNTIEAVLAQPSGASRIQEIQHFRPV